MKVLKKLVLGAVAIEVASYLLTGESAVQQLIEMKQAKQNPGDSGIAIDVIEGPQGAVTIAAVGGGAGL
ncbi:MAG: hypothetical protein ACR2NI_11075 [Pirellulales bacterium]